MDFIINGRSIGPKHPPYIIAELSANHHGSLNQVLEAIKVAKLCGADAVKLQTYTADTMTIECDAPDFLIKEGPWIGSTLYELYKKAETPFEWHEKIFAYAKEIGMTVFSTPFDETAVDLLEKLNTPAYKISSFELLDLPLIRYVASKGKPLILSTGLASEVEIEEAVATAQNAGCASLMLLHCISSYPAPINQSNLRQIEELAKRFKVLTGLSDHTISAAVSIAAVALGACLIEKHFTLSRAIKGPDTEFSIEPDELKRLCSDTKDAWLALGKVGFERQQSESQNKIFRRSIYFVKDLPLGHLITTNDIRRIRPGMGLAPKYLDELIGRELACSVKRGEPANFKHFKK